ncbi:FlaD/FlaE family flagellar protein [Natrarchaeobaculum aegyptiacum]|uniref:Archaeal flagella protein FlaD/E domain-containing protein n=1 Tax=Natrarchaeobaculum aegyptiacum TaxID=745377 RepID=A0A2Z2HSA9_9EURY|nr:FlaD/FlaE family flagellar protein [Natrarchaeobaculum aegyptiacum]ARS88965.1 hypothetical protein B1756_03810 [Natrarchaeobaculum aegyptiacum]
MTLLLALFSDLGGDPDESDDDSGEDDLLGGADDGLMGDDLFGDDDTSSSDEDELNYQLDEIEKEVDSLSGRIETVRGENEQISDSIQTVERNVDKLVDLYEIVTHGINPFVGDQEIGDAFETATGQAGLIGNDPDDAIDEEIASAEAEDFLDDDMPFEDDDTDDFGTDFEDDPDTGADADAPLEDDEFADGDVIDDEPDFAEEDALEPDDGDGADHEDEVVDDEDDLTRFLPDEDEESDAVETDSFDGSVDDSFDEGESVDDASMDRATVHTGSDHGGVETTPYLGTHPSGYAAEITTLEWLEFLVETAGVEGAAQTVAYYRSVGWISEAVETYLHRLLAGFGDEGTLPPTDPDPQSILRTDDHKRSLQYISQIATPEKQARLVNATGGEVVEESPEVSQAAGVHGVESDEAVTGGEALEFDDPEQGDQSEKSAEPDPFVGDDSSVVAEDDPTSIEEGDSVSIDEMKPDPLADQDSTIVGDQPQTHGTGGQEPVDGRIDDADDIGSE